MNIHVFGNEGQRVLYQRFFRTSLRDEWNLVYHELQTKAAADFATQSFKRIIHEKVSRLVTEILSSEDPEGAFLLSDIDIQFFRRCEHVVREKLVDHDIVFQKECALGPEVNTGFIAMRPTPQVKGLWSEVERRLAQCLEGPEFVNEQQIVNMLLPTRTSLKWSTFPDEIWAWSNSNIHLSSENFPNILLHHANCTAPRENRTSLELKVEQMDLVKRTYEQWSNTVLSRARRMRRRLLCRLQCK